MIEAMECGTPTIAFECGSVPEVMKDGVTGFVVSSMDEAIAAVRRAGSLDRAACRAVFQERFTSERMVREYVAVYQQIARARDEANLSTSQEAPLTPSGA
jgi:glycosyltransferase involved in cell wall biosynthesis